MSQSVEEASPAAEGGERSAEWATAAGFLALALLYLQPVLASGANWGFWDWDIFEGPIEAARTSVVRYGQLPGWNPWIGGGESLEAHPLLPLWSPFFLAVLAFGTIPAIKLWVVLRLFLALWGTHRLARGLGLSRLGSVTAAVAFGLASTYAQRVAHGHWNLQAFVYLPLLLYTGLAALEAGAWRARVLCALVLSLMLLEGGPYPYAMGIFALGPLAVIALLRGRARQGIPALAAVLVLSLGLTGVKSLPVWDDYGGGKRERGYGKGEVGDFYYNVFQPRFSQFLRAAWLERQQANRPGRFATFHINTAAYLGPAGLALVALGVLFGGHLALIALLLALPFFWLSLGDIPPINLWALLHRLPVFSSMTLPSKFTACYLLGMAIAAGAGADGIARRLGGTRVARAIPAALLLVMAADQTAVTRPLLAHAFPIEPIEVTPGEFHQVRFSPWRNEYLARVKEPVGFRPHRNVHSLTTNFPAVQANLGVLASYNVQRTKNHAFPDEKDHLTLRHEGGTAGEEPRLLAWSPNELRIAVDPGRGGALLVNHNNDSGWRAFSAEGELGLRPEPGPIVIWLNDAASELTLRYRSRALFRGAALTLVSLLVAAGLWWRGR